jgi:hypothetical protein
MAPSAEMRSGKLFAQVAAITLGLSACATEDGPFGAEPANCDSEVEVVIESAEARMSELAGRLGGRDLTIALGCLGIEADLKQVHQVTWLPYVDGDRREFLIEIDGAAWIVSPVPSGGRWQSKTAQPISRNVTVGQANQLLNEHNRCGEGCVRYASIQVAFATPDGFNVTTNTTDNQISTNEVMVHFVGNSGAEVRG